MATDGVAYPYQQTINLTLPDGTQTPIALPDIDEYVQYGIRICINYASQIGASLLLLVVLLLTARKEKRQTAIFHLNALALAANVVRLILACMYFTSPWYGFYAYFSSDYGAVPRVDYEIGIAVLAVALVLQVCLDASLILQVRAVCVTLPRLYRHGMTLLSVGVSLGALGVRFALSVWNAKYILAAADFSGFQGLAAASNYTVTASICFFSAVFVAKLGHAIHRRRKMHVRQFGPMQVLFIMGCQTLVVPALFAILQNFTSVPELGTQVLTIVALSLPLTSMWATATVQKRERDGEGRGSDATTGQLKKSSVATSASTTASSRRSILSSILSKSSNLLSGKQASPVFEHEMSASKDTRHPVVGALDGQSPRSGCTVLSALSSVNAGDDDFEHDMRMHLGRSMV